MTILLKVLGNILGLLVDTWFLMLLLGVINEFATVVPALAYVQVLTVGLFLSILIGLLSRVVTNSVQLAINNARVVI